MASEAARTITAATCSPTSRRSSPTSSCSGTRGWPVSTITRRPLRLLAGNGLVIGLGTLTYLTLRDPAHWAPDAISAVCGCLIGAVLVVAMFFDGWPAALLRPGPSRALTLALTALARPGTGPRPGRVRRQRAVGQGHP